MINQKMVKLRLKLDWRQEDAANMAGIDRRTYNKIETGSIRRPSWDNVGRIARALNEDPYILFPVPMSRKNRRR